MAEPDAIRTTVEQYLARFADDREGWLALWAPDATMEDPVGSPVRHGIDAIAEFYDQSQASADRVELRPDGPVIVLGQEASFRFFARRGLKGGSSRRWAAWPAPRLGTRCQPAVPRA